MSNDRLVSVEWLRGLASLGVCQMHIFCALEYFSADEVFFQKYIFPLSIAGRLGVPVFFVISGFILPYSMWKRNYKISDFFNFLGRRLARLEPPYILSIILALVAAILVTPILTGKSYIIDPLGLALHLGYLNVFTDRPWINPVYWTLAIEFQYYLLIGLLFPLLTFWKSKYGLDILFLILLGFFINLHFKNLAFITNHIHLFIVGILGFKLYTKTIYTWAFCVLLALSLYFTYDLHAKAYAVSALVSIVVILLNVDVKSRFLYFLGDISYSLYLVHWVLGVEVCRNLFVHYYPDASTFQKLFVGLLINILCVVVSIGFYKLIEKPSIKWSKKLLARSSK